MNVAHQEKVSEARALSGRSAQRIATRHFSTQASTVWFDWVRGGAGLPNLRLLLRPFCERPLLSTADIQPEERPPWDLHCRRNGVRSPSSRLGRRSTRGTTSLSN